MTQITNHMAKTSNDANRKLTIEAVDPAKPGGSYTVYRVTHADGPGFVEVVFQSPEAAGFTNEALLAIVEHRLSAFQDGPFPCAENQTAVYGIRSALTALKNRTERRVVEGLEGKPTEKKWWEGEHGTAAPTGVPRPEGSTGRIVREAFTVWVGDESYDVDERAAVEAAIRRLNPPIRADEIPEHCLVTQSLEAFKESLRMSEPKKEDDKPRVRMEGTTLLIGALGFQEEARKLWKTWSVIESACKRLNPDLTAAEMEVITNSAAHLGSGARNGLTEFKQAMERAGKK